LPNSTQARKAIADLASKRADLERKISDAQRKKASKDKEAADRVASAGRTSATSSQSNYLRQADAAQRASLAESKKIADLSKRIADVARDEGRRNKELAEALKREASAAEQASKKERREREDAERRAREAQFAEKRRRQAERLEDQRTAATLVSQSEERIVQRMAETRSPRREQLRILYATASSEGDLRVDEEIRRVKAVVRASNHRDQVVIEHLPAATAGDLLDGLVTFRPHVVHFSGHANEQVLVFDSGEDSRNAGRLITARAFKSAIEAPDDPPVLVVLNACRSAAQLEGLLGKVPLAVGMRDSIGDVDALTFATRFYRSLAEGQSVSAALATARAEMEMNGLEDHDLPTLAMIEGIDPTDVRLVLSP
jgi:hypothetical protein